MGQTLFTRRDSVQPFQLSLTAPLESGDKIRILRDSALTVRDWETGRSVTIITRCNEFVIDADTWRRYILTGNVSGSILGDDDPNAINRHFVPTTQPPRPKSLESRRQHPLVRTRVDVLSARG